MFIIWLWALPNNRLDRGAANSAVPHKWSDIQVSISCYL